MSFTINTAYTLPEILRSKAPDGSAMPMIDVLSQKVPLVEEGYWERANGDTSHEMLRIASEPTGTLVRYNEGTPLTAVSTVPVVEPLCRIESRLQIDTRILEKAPDPVAYRREREAAHARGMVKTFHGTVFGKGGLGSRGSDLKSIDGLTNRMNAVAANSVKSLGGSGSGTLASIWIIKWGPEGMFFTYPRTMSRAMSVTDMREQPAYDASGNRFEVVMTKMAWEFGLGIADPRAVKRLCNITASGSNSFGNDATGEEALIDLLESLPQGDLTNTAIYCGPTIMAQFRKRLNSKTNMFFTTEDVWGRPQLTFQGVPVVRVDALAADESTIS